MKIHDKVLSQTISVPDQLGLGKPRRVDRLLKDGLLHLLSLK